jgi:hypothetical protein
MIIVIFAVAIMEITKIIGITVQTMVIPMISMILMISTATITEITRITGITVQKMAIPVIFMIFMVPAATIAFEFCRRMPYIFQKRLRRRRSAISQVGSSGSDESNPEFESSSMQTNPHKPARIEKRKKIMEAIKINTILKKDGELILKNLPLREGDAVEVILLISKEKNKQGKSTASALLKSEIIGLWKNRGISDSSALARQLRDSAQNRKI